jgi:hypothetical protein
MGQKQTSHHVRVMSDLPLKADIHQRGLHIRLVPIADDIEAPFGSTHVECCSSMGRVARMALGCATLNTVVGNKRASAALEGRRSSPQLTKYLPSFYIDLLLLAIVNGAVQNGTAVASRHGARKTQRTVSLTRPSIRSSWKSHMSIRSCGPVPHRALGRHKTCHGRGRLAAGQPRRASHDVADLLARRHPLYKSRQHKAPVQRL